MAKKKSGHYITVAGQKVLVDRDRVPLIWPVIAELFENNDKNNLSDAKIAEVVSTICRKDFPTATVRIYRHKYNRGDYNGGVPPEKQSRAISRLNRARIPVEEVQSVRTLIRLHREGVVPKRKKSKAKPASSES